MHMEDTTTTDTMSSDWSLWFTFAFRFFSVRSLTFIVWLLDKSWICSYVRSAYEASHTVRYPCFKCTCTRFFIDSSGTIILVDEFFRTFEISLESVFWFAIDSIVMETTKNVRLDTTNTAIGQPSRLSRCYDASEYPYYWNSIRLI